MRKPNSVNISIEDLIKSVTGTGEINGSVTVIRSSDNEILDSYDFNSSDDIIPSVVFSIPSIMSNPVRANSTNENKLEFSASHLFPGDV